MAAARCPSYAVEGIDAYGNTWKDVITLYGERLDKELKHFWITKKPQNHAYPELPLSAIAENLHD